jgi:hypothetical protein
LKCAKIFWTLVFPNHEADVCFALGLIYSHLLCRSQVVLHCLSYLSHQVVHDMFVHAMCVFLNVSIPIFFAAPKWFYIVYLIFHTR